MVVPRTREFDTEAAVAAATVVFRDRGYEGASIQELVDATGVGRGSLYAAFGSKDGLYLAALDHYQHQQVDTLIEALQADAPAAQVLRSMLLTLVDQIVSDERRLSCLMISAAVERCAHDGQVASKVRHATDSLQDALTDLITEGQRRGELADTHDPSDLARFLDNTMRGLRVMGGVQPDRRALTATVEVALRCLG